MEEKKPFGDELKIVARSPVPEVSGTEPSHRALAARAPLGMAYHVEAGLPFRRECVAACTL